MSHFCNPPEFTLNGKEELLTALANPESLMNFGSKGQPQSCDKRVKSTFIIELIKEIEASGKFPYNSTAYNLAVERLGLPYGDYDGLGESGEGKNKRLSWLVYYAQEFKGNDWLIEQGYSRLTAEMIQQAFDEGKKIELLGESIFGKSRQLYNIRNINGRLYAMLPHKQKYALRVEGQPARLVKG